MDAAILSAQEQRAAYSARLRAAHLKEGYSYDDDGKFQTRPYWPLEPVNRVKPHLWKWSEVRALVQGAGELVGLGRGSVSYDRRVLALTNPGLDGEYSLSGTLFGDIQLIQPGEGAPCHRHTPCAARFIFEGQGWTTVEGERTSLAPGDVVFTGQFTWHDHGNAGDTDLMFLDVLDIPLLQYLAASVWEFDYERVTGSAENRHHPAQTMNHPEERYSAPGLEARFNTKWRRNPAHFGVHKWEKVRAALMANAGEAGSPYDGILMEFTNIHNGGPVGPTMSIYSQMLRPGEKTGAHRHTSSTIYVGIEGRGTTEIDGKTYEWGPRDIFVVPSWAWHSHRNLGDAPAFLHSISDASLIGKLGLWREQRRLPDGTVEDSDWLSAPYGMGPT